MAIEQHSSATHQNGSMNNTQNDRRINHGGLNGCVDVRNDLDQIHMDGNCKSVRQPTLHIKLK
jgi:hypothetical protein